MIDRAQASAYTGFLRYATGDELTCASTYQRDITKRGLISQLHG